VKGIILVAELHHICTNCRGPLRSVVVADGRFRDISFPRRTLWICMHREKLVVGQLLKKMPAFYGIRIRLQKSQLQSSPFHQSHISELTYRFCAMTCVD
jgi:hypothetical protein